MQDPDPRSTLVYSSDSDPGIRRRRRGRGFSYIAPSGKTINSPNNQQRTYYVALQLIHALLSNNEGLVKASCAYMVNRQPTLQLIKATDEGESTSLELVYE